MLLPNSSSCFVPRFQITITADNSTQIPCEQMALTGFFYDFQHLLHVPTFEQSKVGTDTFCVIISCFLSVQWQ